MIEAVIMGLIYLCLVALAVYVFQWVLGQLNITIPEKVMQIIWVIVVLVALLIILRAVLPQLGYRLGSVGGAPINVSGWGAY